MHAHAVTLIVMKTSSLVAPWVCDMQVSMAAWVVSHPLVQQCYHNLYSRFRYGVWHVGIVSDYCEQRWQIWCFCSLLQLFLRHHYNYCLHVSLICISAPALACTLPVFVFRFCSSPRSQRIPPISNCACTRCGNTPCDLLVILLIWTGILF